MSRDDGDRERRVEMSPCGHYIRTPVENWSPEIKQAADAVFQNEPEQIERLNRIRKLITAVRASSPLPETVELQRYGIVWQGHDKQPTAPVLVPMSDGYWTPWHLAAKALSSPLQEQTGDEPIRATLQPQLRAGESDPRDDQPADSIPDFCPTCGTALGES
jgi:hypothetical protein